MFSVLVLCAGSDYRFPIDRGAVSRGPGSVSSGLKPISAAMRTPTSKPRSGAKLMGSRPSGSSTWPSPS